MYAETVEKFAEISMAKSNFLKSGFLKYFLASALAGAYVGFGMILIFSIGAPFAAASSPAVKVLMGASFGIALSMVIFAGSELVTGNHMTMVIGNLSRKVTVLDTANIWIVCWLGNLFGSLLLAFVMVNSGLISKDPWAGFISAVSAAKMNAPFFELFLRGILCNILVCLAVWTSARAKEDTAKLILIWWCLFGFIGSGFEHCVANMSLLGMGAFLGVNPAVSWSGYVNNLIASTLGNIVGGGLLGAVYWYCSQVKASKVPSLSKEAATATR
jgi:nitrite transporter NirC